MFYLAPKISASMPAGLITLVESSWTQAIVECVKETFVMCFRFSNKGKGTLIITCPSHFMARGFCQKSSTILSCIEVVRSLEKSR